MAFVMGNLVLEQSNAPGVGDFVLQGQVAGRQTFAGAIGNGNSTYYWAVQNDGQFEQGEATVQVGASVRVTRDKVAFNSNGTTDKIDFTGLVTVYVEIPAERIPYQRPDGSLHLLGTAAAKDLQADGGTIAETDRTNVFAADQRITGDLLLLDNGTLVASKTSSGSTKSVISHPDGSQLIRLLARDTGNVAVDTVVQKWNGSEYERFLSESDTYILQSGHNQDANTYSFTSTSSDANASDTITVTPNSGTSVLYIWVYADVSVEPGTASNSGATIKLQHFDGSANVTLETHQVLVTTGEIIRGAAAMVARLDQSHLRSDTGDWTFKLAAQVNYPDNTGYTRRNSFSYMEVENDG